MINDLTQEEKIFLEKMEKQREKHKEAQKKYRLINKEKLNEYNKKYQENQRLKQIEINKKKDDIEEIEREIIDIPKILFEKNDILKKNRKKKYKLEETTKQDYLLKYDILNRLFNNRALTEEIKEEIKKVLDNKKNINAEKIFNEMSFVINDIPETIEILLQSYKNKNSYKSYLNVLVVLTSYFKNLNNIHNIYEILLKSISETLQTEREKNEIKENEIKKIINIGENEFEKNKIKLDKIEDILIYGLYILTPARRLEYRKMIITNEKDINNLNDKNYLLINGNKKLFIFNDYKTYKTYKKQIIEIPDILNNVISKYLYITQRKENDLLISLDKDKKKEISEPNFSLKISNVFNKVYKIQIPLRYIRMSWASSLYSKNPSMKEIKELSIKMAHSTNENRLYNKIFK